MRTNKLLLLAWIILIPVTSKPQNVKRFGFELSTGLSVATGKLGETMLNPGLGFEGVFHYRFLQHTAVYTGWGWNRFGADESFAGADVCFEETGYVFGLRYERPFSNSSRYYFLRIGGLYNHIETENKDGEIINDTGHGMGWQMAAGVGLPLGRNWSLTPGLKFNSLSRPSEYEGVSRKLNYNYISFRIGIVKHF